VKKESLRRRDKKERRGRARGEKKGEKKKEKKKKERKPIPLERSRLPSRLDRATLLHIFQTN